MLLFLASRYNLTELREKQRRKGAEGGVGDAGMLAPVKSARLAYGISRGKKYWPWLNPASQGRLGDIQRGEDAGKRKMMGVWVSGGGVFGYSVMLEGVQFFLSYRTFNPYDILGNGLGVGAFCLICVVRAKSC